MHLSFKTALYVLAASCFLAGFSFLLPGVFAQESVANELVDSDEYEILDDEGTTMAAQLYVDYIDLTASEYAPGDAVIGSFMLFNTGLRAATDVWYRVTLTTLAEVDGFTYPEQTLEISDASAPISVPSGEQRIEFSYVLPDTVPNKPLGIMIEVFANDELATDGHIPVVVTGDTKNYLDIRSLVYVNGDEEYTVLEGPTVEKEETISLQTTLAAEASSFSTVIPQIMLIAGPNTSGEIINERTLDVLSVAQGETLTETYALPTTLDPGVYTVVVSYFDTQGELVGFPVEARYIIGGLKPKIHSISFNSLDHTDLETFVAVIDYADVPFNVRRNENGGFMDPRTDALFIQEGEDPNTITGYPVLSNLSVKVRITDPNTDAILSVGETENPIDNPIEVALQPITGVSVVRATIELYQDDELIDTEEMLLEITPKQEANDMSWWNLLLNNDRFTMAAVLVVVVLILLVLVPVLMLHRRHVSGGNQ